MRSKAALPQAGHRVPLRPLIPVLSKPDALFSQPQKKIPASEKEKKQGPDSQPGTERAKKKTARKNGRSFGNVLYLRAQRSVQAEIDNLDNGVES